LKPEIRAGVAGAGVFGGYHAAKYAALPGVVMAAAFDKDAARARALADRYGAAAFTDYDAFLAAVDAVTIATPASHHFTYAQAALSAGRHALVEKPLALDIEDAEALVDLAARRGVVLQVGHQERFVAEALGLFERGRSPRRVRCVRVNPRSGRGEDVSVVLDLMIHDIDLLRRLPLGPLVAVSATGDRDDAEAELCFANGARAILHASRTAPVADRRMAIDYEDGAVAIDFMARTVKDTTKARQAVVAFEKSEAEPAFSDPLGFGVARFVAAIRGQSDCPIPGEEGRDALEWAVMIDRALAATLARPALKRVAAS
jgi:predicted dehydrogenase